MKKNNVLVEQYKKNKILEKRLKEEIENVVTEVYSCFALTLKKRNMSNDEIEKLFSETQALWNECVTKDIKMPEWCFEETGIDVRQY